MVGFPNYKAMVESFEEGRTWISTFRKQIAATATVTGQWYDYSYASGNPIPNYYAASPLTATVLEANKGIIVPEMSSGEQQYLHRTTVMSAAASATSVTNQNQHLVLMDYLLYYPFVDMDDAGTDQVMDNTITLPRYEDGIGVQIIVVAQSPTIGGGRFTITYTDSDDVEYTTTSMFCGAAQPAGALVNAVTAVGGLVAFVPLNAGVKGVKNIVSCNFSIANGGLCSIVLVKPITNTYIREESRRTTSGTLESFGDAVEKEFPRHAAVLHEIKSGAFLGFIGRGAAGSLASSVLMGCLETVWR